MRTKAPGPGTYNSLSAFKRPSPMKNGFGSSKKITDIVYYKELQKSYASKHAPGPGSYDQATYFKGRKPGGKINPSGRPNLIPSVKHMKNGKSYNLRELDILDDHTQFIKLRTKQGQVKIGTAPREYDPIFAAKGLFNFNH